MSGEKNRIERKGINYDAYIAFRARPAPKNPQTANAAGAPAESEQPNPQNKPAKKD